MGQMKRRETREAASHIVEENRYLGDKTLGAMCAAGVVTLNVSCQNCPRHGRYRITRLIDRHGAQMKLVELKPILAGECPTNRAWPGRDRCPVYYPGISRHVVKYGL